MCELSIEWHGIFDASSGSCELSAIVSVAGLVTEVRVSYWEAIERTYV